MTSDKQRPEPRPRPTAKITMFKRDMRHANAGGRLSRQLTRRLAGRRLKAA